LVSETAPLTGKPGRRRSGPVSLAISKTSTLALPAPEAVVVLANVVFAASVNISRSEKVAIYQARRLGRRAATVENQ
jgi:hypothetical protein